MVFCNASHRENQKFWNEVTILILIDGFLQCPLDIDEFMKNNSHNPYFNRWFSAIPLDSSKKNNGLVTILILIDGFLQYKQNVINKEDKKSHNP